MLTKEQRFHGRTALRPVYNKGRAVHGRYFKFIYLPTSGTGMRAAVVVSKKVHKSAVVRNRIRRRIYTQLAHILKENTVQADIIVVVRDALVATIPADELANEVGAAVKKITV